MLDVLNDDVPNSRSIGIVIFVRKLFERRHVVFGDEHPIAGQHLEVRGRYAAVGDPHVIHRQNLSQPNPPGRRTRQSIYARWKPATVR